MWTSTGAGAGAGTGAAWTGAAGGAASPARAPQLPQNFSSGARGLLQALHRFFSTTGATAGDGAMAGTGPGVSSSCEAPQFRQNLALSATGFPHSGQNTMDDHATMIIPERKKGLLFNKGLDGEGGIF